MSPSKTAVLGGLMIALGPFSMALYTPAMPSLTEFFGTTDAAIKATLTAYFAGFAGAQLVCGPLSDAFGRKPVILWFLAIYMAASVLALIAPNVDWLIAARVAQGVGAAVGVSTARALVRDLFEGAEAVRIMNLVGIMLGVGPAIAPTIGGITLDLFGWEAIFLVMVLYGAALAAALWAVMPETLPAGDAGHARDGGFGGPRRLLRTYLALAGDPRFMRPTLVIGCTLGAIYAMGTMLPFVMIDIVGLSPTGFGLSMIAQSGSFILGSATMTQALKRTEGARLVPIGFAVTGAGAVAMSFNILVLAPSAAGIMVSLALFSFGLPFLLAQLTTEAMRPYPHVAGSAAAMIGFIQMGGGLVGSAAALPMANAAVALGIIPLTMAALAVGFYTILRRPAARRDSGCAPAE